MAEKLNKPKKDGSIISKRKRDQTTIILPEAKHSCSIHRAIDQYVLSTLEELQFLNEGKLEVLWDLNPTLCVNCGHPVKRNYEYGSQVNPFKTFHECENYGTKQCPQCDCTNPEHPLPDPKERSK